MAIKKVFTCASCDSDFDIAHRIIPTNPIINGYACLYGKISVKAQALAQAICEGCFQDGVLDDININGDMASVNTSEVY